MHLQMPVEVQPIFYGSTTFLFESPVYNADRNPIKKFWAWIKMKMAAHPPTTLQDAALKIDYIWISFQETLRQSNNIISHFTAP